MDTVLLGGKMSAAVDVDIAALVGEMEAVPCEHYQHGIRATHTDEPASHYAQGKCPTCKGQGTVTAVCPGFVRLVLSGAQMKCAGCSSIHPSTDLITILGPVSGK